MEIILKDGRTYEKELYDLKGSPNNPVGWAELEAKFLANAASMLSADRSKSLVQQFRCLDQQDDMGRFDTALTIKAGPAVPGKRCIAVGSGRSVPWYSWADRFLSDRSKKSDSFCSAPYGKYIEFMSFSQGLIQGMNMRQVHGQRKRRA